MASSMTTEQANVRNADEFRKQLAILDHAVVGVILCRTREPYRAIDTIKSLAFGMKKPLPLYLWTTLNGWSKFSPNGAVEAGDNVKDPNMAMQKIGSLDGQSVQLDDGFYAFMYPHFYLKLGGSIPAIIQSVKEYARLFSHSESRRLVLVGPPGYTLPPELEDDVTILDFDLPSYAELGTVYDDQISDMEPAKRPRFDNDERARILAAGVGMGAHEFETALARALVTHRAKLPNVTVDEIGGEVMKVKIEVVKKSEVLEVMETTPMDEIGGLDNLKEWLADRQGCFSQEAADQGVEAPKGIALIGPPGTGKSLLAKGTAHMLGLPLIKFDISRVFAGLVGQSEERVRAALKMIDSMAPCVAMLDEVDKSLSTSQGGDGGIAQRVLGAILTHMQESKAPIFWVATANRVVNLPAEFLRRGRLDEVFSVSIPDAAERMEVLRIHLKKRKVDPDTVGNLAAAIAGSEGFVPAEIEAAVKDAKVATFSRGIPMTGNLIAEQFANMKPLSEAFAEQFQAMQSWAENNARPASRSTEARAPRARSRPRITAVEPSSRPTNLDD